MYGVKSRSNFSLLKGTLTDSVQPKAAPVPKAGGPSTPAPATNINTPAAPAAPAPQPATAPSNQPSTPTPSQTNPQAPAAAAGAEGGGFGDPSAFLIGNRNESTVREMEAMGFARPEIDRALRAAFFNPDRAIEYLLSGIPDNIQAEQRQATPAAAAPQGNPTSPPTAAAAPAQPAAPAPAAAAPPSGDEPINLFEAAAQAGQNRGGGGGGGARRAGAGAGLAGLGAGATAGLTTEGGAPNIEFLRNSPHFQQLRQFVQQQPAMLEPILQQLAEGNPELAQMIGSNQDQFLQLLAEVSPFHNWLLDPRILIQTAGPARRRRRRWSSSSRCYRYPGHRRGA